MKPAKNYVLFPRLKNIRNTSRAKRYSQFMGLHFEGVDSLCKMTAYSTESKNGADSGQAISSKKHTIYCIVLYILHGTLKFSIKVIFLSSPLYG